MFKNEMTSRKKLEKVEKKEIEKLKD